jgi:histidine triad (HIT) family protein
VKSNPVLDILAKASKGLLFESESEGEFEPFLWKDGGDLSDKHLLQLIGTEPDTTVEPMSLEDFFYAVPKEDKPNFDKLGKVLKDQLTGVKVYKVGDEAEKDVYIVGKTKDGLWAGLKTTVVET